MTGDGNAFDDRKKSQEAKYKMDEERRFKLRARRNKLLGLWVAARMGLDGAEAQDFAKNAVMMGLDVPNDAKFVSRLCARTAEAGTKIDDARLAEELRRVEKEAERQLTTEFPAALDTDHEQVGG